MPCTVYAAPVRHTDESALSATTAEAFGSNRSSWVAPSDMIRRMRPDFESARVARVQNPDTVGTLGSAEADAPGARDADATAPEADAPGDAFDVPGVAGGSDPHAETTRSAARSRKAADPRVLRNTTAW